jgi:hypothetical protein
MVLERAEDETNSIQILMNFICQAVFWGISFDNLVSENLSGLIPINHKPVILVSVYKMVGNRRGRLISWKTFALEEALSVLGGP